MRCPGSHPRPGPCPALEVVTWGQRGPSPQGVYTPASFGPQFPQPLLAGRWSCSGGERASGGLQVLVRLPEEAVIA